MKISDLYRLPTKTEVAEAKWIRPAVFMILAIGLISSVAEAIRQGGAGAPFFEMLSGAVGLIFTSAALALALLIYQTQAISSIAEADPNA